MRHLACSGLYKHLCVIFLFFSALASILRAWLDQCPEDFQEPPSYPSLHRVLGFLQKAMPGSEPMRRAQSLLEQLRVQASLENESEGKSCPDTGNYFIHTSNLIPLFLFMFVLSSCAYKNNCCPLVAGGFQYANPFCLGEDEELEIDLQEDFFSFEVDLVAEQLTYMDAVRDLFFLCIK